MKNVGGDGEVEWGEDIHFLCSTEPRMLGYEILVPLVDIY